MPHSIWMYTCMDEAECFWSYLFLEDLPGCQACQLTLRSRILLEFLLRTFRFKVKIALGGTRSGAQACHARMRQRHDVMAYSWTRPRCFWRIDACCCPLHIARVYNRKGLKQYSCTLQYSIHLEVL
eukprot:jgi/Botrbrau1/13547/Bobra.4_2s0005.1